MNHERRRRRTLIPAVAVLVPLLVILGFGLALAGTAGILPWQPEPTRIPITPFADIPGFAAPTVAPTAPPVRATPTVEAAIGANAGPLARG